MHIHIYIYIYIYKDLHMSMMMHQRDRIQRTMSESIVQTEIKRQQQQPTRKQVRQPPSVPFIWEHRPGFPKPDWTPYPAAAAAPLPPPPPVKLIASVPFAWEETPGKPFPCFADDPSSPEPLDPPHELLYLPPPPMYANLDLGDGSDGSSSDDISRDSFSSAPSLLAANCLVPSGAVSCAVPVDEFDDLKRETAPASSPGYESDDSTSSYMTGASSLVGASFLEKLFPLLPPDSGLVRNVQADSVDTSGSRGLAEEKHKAFETSIGYPVRKPPTLGELIMMSRRRSYMRRAIEMRKQNPPMEFSKDEAARCCLFVPGIKMMEGLEWKKYQPRLKLI